MKHWRKIKLPPFGMSDGMIRFRNANRKPPQAAAVRVVSVKQIIVPEKPVVVIDKPLWDWGRYNDSIAIRKSKLQMKECKPQYSHSKDYLDWVQQANLKPLTKSQYYFAEFLLRNRDEIGQIGDMENVFLSVRRYLRKATSQTCSTPKEH